MSTVQHAASQAPSSVKGLDKSRSSVKGGAPGTDPSGEFSGLFGAMMEGIPGQDLAALAVETGPLNSGSVDDTGAKKVAAGDGQNASTAVGLASEILGPSVHIITSTEPAISDDSLMAFARSQGLDEDALAMIFGRRTVPDLGTQIPAAATTALPADGSAPSANDVLAAQVLSGKAGMMNQTAAGLGTKPTQDSTRLAAQATSQGETLELGPDARLSWRIGEAHSLNNTQQPASSSNLPSALFGLNGVRAMPAETQVTQTAAAEPATHPEAANQSLAASLILGAAEASQFARRVQAKQTGQRAERVGDLLNPNNTSTLMTTTNPAVGSTGVDGVASEELSLDTDLSDSDLQQLIQQRQPESRHLNANQNTSSPEQATRSDLDLRAEQYDKLSQRLAEALGQRLAAQIARGDWKVEMALRPKDLGNIDIELHMKSGELQASFSASQMGTRDLIADGVPRLKEVLAQLGMEVASVDVNVRQESQHGGNSTPGRNSTGIERTGQRRSAVESSAANPLPPARSTASASDGLDVLV